MPRKERKRQRKEIAAGRKQQPMSERKRAEERSILVATYPVTYLLTNYTNFPILIDWGEQHR